MSIALAVIGEMLTEAEAYATDHPMSNHWAERVALLRHVRDKIVAAEGLSYTLPSGQRVVGSIRREPLPSDAEVREMLRNDRELMRDEMHGRDIDGSLRW